MTNRALLNESDYTKLAEQLADEYARNYHGAPQSMSAEFNETRPRVQHQRAAMQPTNDLSGLSSDEAEEVTKRWQEEAAESAKLYAEARNRGSQPVSHGVEDKKLVEETELWIERQKSRGHYGGRKAK